MEAGLFKKRHARKMTLPERNEIVRLAGEGKEPDAIKALLGLPQSVATLGRFLSSQGLPASNRNRLRMLLLEAGKQETNHKFSLSFVDGAGQEVPQAPEAANTNEPLQEEPPRNASVEAFDLTCEAVQVQTGVVETLAAGLQVAGGGTSAYKPLRMAGEQLMALIYSLGKAQWMNRRTHETR